MATKECDQIEGLEREWRDALCKKDMERLKALVHDDFVLIGTRSSGPFMMHRQEWLDAIKRRDRKAVTSLLATACGTSLDVHRYEPGVYKGSKDPLLAAHNTPEQTALLKKRFSMGQADR